ncbi:porin [Prochlorococcus sp. AH-716-P20]|nr:porin [Prochlorococcus sp. AH-716-P20]
MKLFKSLLVAPATLGLLAPMYANATEVNLNEISNYSDVESIEFANSFNNDKSTLNPLLAGGEGLVDDHSHDDGSFSKTTTASFSADFLIGATDDDDGSDTAVDSNDSIMAGYSFQIDLNTSFTGEDSLDISIDGGNASGAGYAEFDGNSTGDMLKVDGVSYTFPLGGATAFVGDNTDGSFLFTTACVYGGPSDTLDDCGNVNAGITGGEVSFGGSYDFDNGFTTAVGVQTGNAGILTEETQDAYALNAAYTGENYGLSLTYASGENAALTDDDTVTAFNGYYTPDGDRLPSISVGYEVGEAGGVDSSIDGFESFFVGLTWDEVGPGSAGIALGHSTTIEGSDEEYMYEAYYEYPVNDGMTITPLVFVKENATAGSDDTTGAMVKTSFSF